MTHNDPRENSADVSVMSVQSLPSILILKADTLSLEARLLGWGWRQSWELIREIYSQQNKWTEKGLC